MSKLVARLGLCLIFVVSSMTTLNVQGANSVYISELNYNGSSVNGGDKWVELHNPTSNLVNLDGWKLKMPNSSKTGNINLLGSIPANGFYIVGVKNAKFLSVLPRADLIDFNITNISNTTPGTQNYISIQLQNTSGTILSEINYGDSFVKSQSLGYKGSIKHSLECDIYRACSGSTELYGTTGLDFGTPGKIGFVNTDTSEPVRDAIIIPSVLAPMINDMSTVRENTTIPNLAEPKLDKTLGQVETSPIKSGFDQKAGQEISTLESKPILQTFKQSPLSFSLPQKTNFETISTPQISLQSLVSPAKPISFSNQYFANQAFLISILSLIKTILKITTKTKDQVKA
jgi:hypothetical protein